MAKSMNFVPCMTWIKRGVAKAHPEQVVVTEDELKKIIDETKDELQEMGISSSADPSDPTTSLSAAECAQQMDTDTPNQGDDADIVDRYGFEDYDDSDTEANVQNNPLDVAGLVYYPSNDEDPYITLKGNDGESDDEDLEVKPDDNMLVVARVKENENILEFFIYNESSDDLYVHHDILLTSFPLCVEWLDYNQNDASSGNFVAVGGMDSMIEIWDVDVLNSLEACFTLGTKKKSKKKKSNRKGHSDAVLDLSWNRMARNVIASASADQTIALWDLQNGSIVTSLTKHTDKVQTLAWHPFEAQTLLSGSFDKTAILYDCRSPDETNKLWKVNGEVERVIWNHFSPYYFLMSTDQGFVYLADVRSDKVLFTLSAHTSACTGIALSPKVPDLLVTSSADHTVKMWDIANNSPKMVHEQNLRMGAVHCVAPCPDAGFVFAAGCQNDVKLWNLKNNRSVMQQFANREIQPKEFIPGSQ